MTLESEPPRGHRWRKAPAAPGAFTPGNNPAFPARKQKSPGALLRPAMAATLPRLLGVGVGADLAVAVGGHLVMRAGA
jgi:hypothetical protein